MWLGLAGVDAPTSPLNSTPVRSFCKPALPESTLRRFIGTAHTIPPTHARSAPPRECAGVPDAVRLARRAAPASATRVAQIPLRIVERPVGGAVKHSVESARRNARRTGRAAAADSDNNVVPLIVRRSRRRHRPRVATVIGRPHAGHFFIGIDSENINELPKGVAVDPCKTAGAVAPPADDALAINSGSKKPGHDDCGGCRMSHASRIWRAGMRLAALATSTQSAARAGHNHVPRGTPQAAMPSSARSAG